jgi:hypothetical protein
MTDAELTATIWPIYRGYVGRLNTPETRADFRADVHAVLGPDSEDRRLVCDITNNPPAFVAVGGFGFDLFFKRDGKTFCLTSDVH